MSTIEKYVRQSFAGASEVNLSKLLRVAAKKAVNKVNIWKKMTSSTFKSSYA